MHRSTFLGILGPLALICGVVIAIPLFDPPGSVDHAGNASACQEGRWESLAREESPSVSLRNQDECIRYRASGGTLVQLESPRIRVFMQWLGLELCAPVVEALSFPPDSRLTVVENYRNIDGTSEQSVPVAQTTDAGGALAFYGAFPGPSDVGNSYQVSIAGISSGWIPVNCGA